MDDEGSAGRASAGPVAPSARGTCRRPDDSRRATADGGAVGAAAAAPPVGGALVVAWAALRRRSGRPGSGGSLRRHGFERGCRASSGAGWLRAGLREHLFSFLASNESAVRALKVRDLILESLSLANPWSVMCEGFVALRPTKAIPRIDPILTRKRNLTGTPNL